MRALRRAASEVREFVLVYGVAAQQAIGIWFHAVQRERRERADPQGKPDS